MSRSLIHGTILVTILLVLIAGCSNNPTTPPVTGAGEITEVRQVEAVSNHLCLGCWSVILDKANMSVEIEPWRNADIHLNLTQIFVNTMGLGIAVVPAESDPANGLFAFDFTLTHPIPLHPEFTAFDVKGIVMAPGTLAVDGVVFSDLDETQLVNADGYTRWWNPTEFTQPGIFGYTDGLITNTTAASLTATINPYKVFADALGPTDGLSAIPGGSLSSPEGRLLFSAGVNNTRRYLVQFPMTPDPEIVFGYVIDGSWAEPFPNPPVNVPDDFPMAANQPEAYYVLSHQTFNTLYYDTESGTGGGRLGLQANVYDWQGQEAGDVAGDIGSVQFFCPDLLSGGSSAVFLSEVDNKARYHADLTGLTVPTQAGEVFVATRVECEGSDTYSQFLPFPAPDPLISAWNTITVDVVDPDCTADDDNDFPQALTIGLETDTVGQLCAATDSLDYYKFEIPAGYEITGRFALYCDPVPTRFAIFDTSQTKLSEIYVLGGMAEIQLDGLGLMPGTQYLRVYTETLDQAFLYTIEPHVEFVNVTPSEPVDVTSGDLFLNPKFITSYDNYVYAGGDDTFWIYDYSDPANPVRLCELKIGMDIKPALTYPYLYYYKYDPSGDYFVGMIDVSNPSEPVVYPQVLTFTGYINALQAEPGYLYVAWDDAPVFPLDIFDISSDPTVPAYINSITLSQMVREMVFHRDQGGPDYWLGIRFDYLDHQDFYNITDKMTITGPVTATWTPGDQVTDFVSSGNYIFTTIQNGGSYSIESLYLDTGGIVYKNNDSLGDRPLQIVNYYALVFIANEEADITVVSVYDPDNPNEDTDYDEYDANIEDMEIVGPNLILAMGNAGIGALDCLSIYDYGRESGFSDPNDLLAYGDYLYSIESDDPYKAIKTFDISDPATAYFISEDETPYGFPFTMAVDGDRMVIGTQFPRLLAYDLTDPSVPDYLGNHDPGVNIWCVGMRGDFLAMGSTTPSIEVFYIASWPTMTFSVSLPLVAIPYDFQFKGDVMFVLAGPDIEYYDISNPLLPTYIGTIMGLSDINNLEIEGDYLFLATENDLEVYDITDAMVPTFVVSEPHPDSPHGEYIATDGQFAILQPYWTTPPTVFQIWPPDSPSVVGPLYDAGLSTKPNDTFCHNGYYYEYYPDGPLRIWGLY